MKLIWQKADRNHWVTESEVKAYAYSPLYFIGANELTRLLWAVNHSKKGPRLLFNHGLQIYRKLSLLSHHDKTFLANKLLHTVRLFDTRNSYVKSVNKWDNLIKLTARLLLDSYINEQDFHDFKLSKTTVSRVRRHR